ncbi:MAG: tRNA (N6-isopentenyl adenosine(37)-C2)-methylthiotransferase MiaB [Myxococcales bacterium]|nr:tRNA (N6-isopentenyl adenosine(37)-C2)-methylthiotransferase MiaB [Myxococcales bacterium]
MAAPVATTGPVRSVYIETYGCQMNVADSDLMVSVMAQRGFATTTSAEQADVILINTCAVREKAEDRVFARAAELGAGKKLRPHQVLGIVGCMAEHLKEKIVARAPAVDIVAGPDSYRRLADLVDRVAAQRATPAAADDVAGPALYDVKLDKAETYEGLSGAIGGDGVSGFVTVQRGCDKFCTFCVVPFTRGRERGVAPRDILRQVREFAERGYKEVVLLGQTVNSYVWEDISFAELLRTVAEMDGIERVRFTSPYPIDFTDEVIAAIASNDKISKYVHLPVQSGSDDVLARMKRGYTVSDFRDIVGRLRAAVPHIAFSTDILSGFCGETEADHELTLQLMRDLRFDSAFMFSYSERSLTYASKHLPDDVPPDVKKRRLADIVKLQERLSGEIFAEHIGRRERVLIHGPSKRDATQLMGRTDGFKSVILPSGVGAIGELVDVTITRATMATLFGTPA